MTDTFKQKYARPTCMILGSVFIGLFMVWGRGFYAARSLYTPGGKWIKKCDVKINELMRVEQTQQETPYGPTRRGKSELASQQATSPSTLWSVIVEIGFLGWIGSAIGIHHGCMQRSSRSEILDFSGHCMGIPDPDFVCPEACQYDEGLSKVGSAYCGKGENA